MDITISLKINGLYMDFSMNEEQTIKHFLHIINLEDCQFIKSQNNEMVYSVHKTFKEAKIYAGDVISII